MAIEIRAAGPNDRPEVARLLAANGLPLDGLEITWPSLLAAFDGEVLVGCAAAEPYGRDGLLRSVCVAPEYRGRGLGERLVGAVEELSRKLGIADLYLLTETAAGWFPRLGYEVVERASAPAPIAGSPEFASVCPVSSVFMRKSIGSGVDAASR